MGNNKGFGNKKEETKHTEHLEYSIFNNALLRDNDFTQKKYAEQDKRKKSKIDKKSSKSKEKQKRKGNSKEDKDLTQKIAKIRMTSPTFEQPEHINIHTEDDLLDSMKQTGTFLSPFESDKGRNRTDKHTKTSNKSKKKSHSRCKSGVAKVPKRHNLNKSVLE